MDQRELGLEPAVREVGEERFELPRPVPIYMTYLTVAATQGRVVFRPDPYGLDTLAMPQMFDGPRSVAAAPSQAPLDQS